MSKKIRKAHLVETKSRGNRKIVRIGREKKKKSIVI